LEINYLNDADFGSYMISITNIAGTTASYIDLHKPEGILYLSTFKQQSY